MHALLTCSQARVERASTQKNDCYIWQHFLRSFSVDRELTEGVYWRGCSLTVALDMQQVEVEGDLASAVALNTLVEEVWAAAEGKQCLVVEEEEVVLEE